MNALLPELALGWRRAVRGPSLPALLATLALCLLFLPGRDDPGLVRTGYGVVLAWMLLHSWKKSQTVAILMKSWRKPELAVAIKVAPRMY